PLPMRRRECPRCRTSRRRDHRRGGGPRSAPRQAADGAANDDHESGRRRRAGRQRARVDRTALTERRTLGLLAAVCVHGMTTWFSASAVIPQLQDSWHLSSTTRAWLTIAVQLGFVT